MQECWRAFRPFDVDTAHSARYDSVVTKHEDVVWSCLTDDATLLEVRKMAILDD